MGASEKRKDYISWDEYFMGIAMLSGMRSKDPNTQVGACIVDPEHKILSMGYNGFPLGCSDDEFTWAREGEDNKYFYSTHSELNAILNYRGGSLEGATIYVTLFPCNECAKAIIQSGIREVVYDCDKYEGTASVTASKRMLNALIMVFQFGINMIVPIFLCTLAGVWIGKKTGADWVTVPLFFLGAFAGANNIYRMVQKFLKPEDDGRAVRQTPGRQSTTETEISDSISRVEKDVKKNK